VAATSPLSYHRRPVPARSRGLAGALVTVALVAVTLAAVVLAGCSAGKVTAATKPAPASSGPSSAASTLWLCRPGVSPDPCASDLAATAITPTGGLVPQALPLPSTRASAFDCFYVYPTAVNGPGDNAPLKVKPAITAVAVAQASRFSQVCRVWAPVYEQRTALSLAKGLGGDPAADAIAYASLLSAWQDYLTHDNGGRPIVFIGHSQGAAMLIRLLRAQIYDNSALRTKLVSALIIGGNVQVAAGTDQGGSFQSIPACGSATQTGCVIAYSSFPSEPPAGSEFGRPGQGVSLQSAQTASTGQSVLCVDPAALGGGTGDLLPYYPTSAVSSGGQSVTTPWVEYPGLYQARCQHGGGASWLEIQVIAGAGDPAPRVSQTLGAEWGFHADDVNLALGNLVADVGAEENAYRP